MANQEILLAAVGISSGSPGTVAGAGHHQQIEILARLDEGVDHLHRRGGIDVAVHLADDQEQFAAQLVGVGHIGLLGVMRADRPAHPQFVPPDLIHAVVMAAAIRHGHFVKVGMEQNATERILAAGRAAEDADAAKVHVWILRRGCLHPQDAIGEAGVAEVLAANVMERLGTIVRAHAVDLHDDEPQLGEALMPVEGTEVLRHERALRPGVDLLDHGIFLVGIEVRRAEDDAVNIRLAVASLGDESLGHFPASLQQGPHVGALQLADELAVPHAPQLGHGGHIHTRIRVEEEPAIRRIGDRVRTLAFRQNGQAAAVEVDPAIMDVIRVLFGVDAAGAEPDLDALCHRRDRRRARPSGPW